MYFYYPCTFVSRCGFIYPCSFIYSYVKQVTELQHKESSIKLKSDQKVQPKSDFFDPLVQHHPFGKHLPVHR